MLNSLRTRLFGNASARSVAFRTLMDFAVANLVLVAAASLRLLMSGQLQFDNPVNQLVGKVNSTYLVHASWFSVSAVGLFVVCGVYRPVPSAKIRQRLMDITRACGIGLVLHVVIGTQLQQRFEPTLEVAIPAWSILLMAVFSVRLSRMSLTTHFRVAARDPKSRSGKVEDVLVVWRPGLLWAGGDF